ncbi:MAG: carbohydrate-binding domain-containing protein, partial [Tetrasphaera sp.]|nr:carbohydrate-binding domain-containing protein [Tetrasphaera sp.]
MKTNRIAKGLVALSAALALTACGTSLGSIADVGATTSSGTTSSAVATTATDGSYTIHAQADDVDYDASTAKTIALGSGNVEITEPGTYILTGTLSNGQVIVNSSAEGKVRIVLSNASITNSSGAAIDVRAADEVVVVLAEGTSNSLTDGSGYDTSGEDAADAALFSMADLTIGGTGSLIVTGNTADGIASKDGLVILGGTITVKAADDGIRGKDY